MDEEQIIIDIQFNANDAARKAADLRAAIAELKKENAALAEEVKKGNIPQAQAAKQMAENEKLTKEYKATLKAMNGQIQATIDHNETFGDSLHEMRAALAQLKNEYASLSKAERESAAGKEMLQKLADLNDQVKQAEYAFGDFQRNVGNYPKAMADMLPGTNALSGALNKMGLSFGDLAKGGKAALTSIGSGLKNLGKSMLTPPIGLIVIVLSAIMVAIQKLRDAFAKNDDASTRMSAAMAKLQPIMTAVSKVFDLLATAISYVVEWLVNAAVKFAQFIPIVAAFKALFPEVVQGFAEEAEGARQLELALDKLQDTEREYTVNSAKRNAEVAQLRSKAQEAEKYSYEEREKFLKQAISLEKQNLKDEQDIAQERLRILKEQAKQNADTSDEMKNKISKAQAEVYRARQSYADGTRKLYKQLDSVQKEHTKELQEQEKQRVAAIRAAAEERKKIAENLARLDQQITEKSIELMQEGIDREIAAVQARGAAQVAALKKTEVSTAEERAKIEQLILLSEQATADKIADLYEKNAAEEVARVQELEQRKLNAQIELATKGSEEYFELRATAAERVRDKALADETLLDEERLVIEKNYQDELARIETEKRQERAQAARSAIEEEWQRKQEELDLHNASEVERLQAQLQYEREYLNSLSEDQFESIEAYEQAKIKSNAKVEESEKKLKAAMAAQAASAMDSASKILGAFTDALEQFGEENESAARFAKVLALFQIGIDTAKAISGGVAQAMSVAFPGNLAAIATTIAAVVANIVQATNIIKGLNEPKFAAGGIVGGNLYTGDNVTAKVNSGEMILNQQQQAALFDLANGKGSVGIDYGQMAAAMTAAVASQPAPVMSYTEFKDFEQKVSTYNEIARL